MSALGAGIRIPLHVNAAKAVKTDLASPFATITLTIQSNQIIAKGITPSADGVIVDVPIHKQNDKVVDTPIIFSNQTGRKLIIERQPATADRTAACEKSLTAALVRGTMPLNPAKVSTAAVIVPLDGAGVASWMFMNPLNPVCIRCQFDSTR
jgi:hypothetical protein